MNHFATTFADLSSNRKDWVEITRKNGYYEGITNLLTELYPDNAHFIYELLQNAEDTQADTVHFALSDTGIQFKHNGKRLFNLKDVESITSIGVSTKRNDPTNIGKFGVGFKAVFAYTNTPEIQSGEFHFKIENLVVPESLPNTTNDGFTAFHFPFDNPKKAPAKAVAEIERGLRELADNTLLFLNHIREIEYLLPNGQSGKIVRVDVDGEGIGRCIEIHATQAGEPETVSNWLRYRNAVSVTDEDGETKMCQVAVAFRIEPSTDNLPSEQNDESKRRRKPAKPITEWKVVSCEPGQVSIFFPAEKETSNLRFHLHAPFASTVARDSVRDCDANEGLRDALAQLTSEALEDIRIRGLLTMSFLAVLPNKDDGLPKFYEPIREAIVNAFQERDLVPTKSGSHLKATGLFHGPAEIASVIEDEDLSFLTEYKPPLWAVNPSQKGQREDKFLDSLNIEKWGWQELKDSIGKTEQNEEHKSKLEKWLSEKADNWMMRFYALMESCHEKTRSYPPLSAAWKSLMGIRVIDGKESVDNTTPSDAFFPPKALNEGKSKSIDVPTKIWLVKPDVYEKGRLGETTKKAARDFLERVGVREYDERAEIERRLEWYSKPGQKTIAESHYRDIRSFIIFLKNNPTAGELFKEVGFLVTMNDATPSGLYWTKPGDAFLDDPYEATGLDQLTDIHGKRKLWPDYLAHLGKNISKGDFVSFLKSVGVFFELAVTRTQCWQNNKINRWSGRSTNTGSNVDWTIRDIEKYLSVRRQSASRLIWMGLLRSDKRAATANFRPNQQHNMQVAESQLVQHLKSRAWIPDKQGSFHFPQNMTRDMLPNEFPYDDSKGLLTAIGFGEKITEAGEEFQTLDIEAKKVGFESAEELQEARELLKAKREGRIREMPKESLDLSDEDVSSGHASPPTGAANESRNGSKQPVFDSPLIREIQSRRPSVREADSPGRPRSVSAQPNDESEDVDDYTPKAVDYGKKLDRAKDRYASELDRIECDQELHEKANVLPRYCYGWFLALLELECNASSEKNADGKTISIRFGKVERDANSTRSIVLKEPSRFIPQSIEEFSGVRVDLDFGNGRTGKLRVESFTAKEFSLLGKLESADDLNGIDLDEVLEARIEVQNPSFLLQELLERFRELRFDESFDMKANLTPNVEFVFGPPGTGKTTHLAEKVLIPMMQGTKQARVLVLTPTNKAADVLTTRMMEKMDTDTSYLNWLVRFGTSADERIEKAGVWRDRSFNIGALGRSVTVTTIARFAYDGFAGEHGKKLYEMKWDAIVIDEASMIPIANIIYPLYRQKPQKFIIAGDPFQIEPIVAVEQWKEQNIYTLVGLDKTGSFGNPVTEPHAYSVTNLDTQYRSIPAIGDVFSRFTYDGILKHHRQVGSQHPLKVNGLEAKPLNLIKFPVSKYESIYRAKRLESGTPYQTYSALFTFEFVRWLAGQIKGNHANKTRIGVIAPYRAQANLLNRLNDSWTTKPDSVDIQVGTIHGFQGDECDIIIAVLNPPPTISTNSRMFLNKQNILNVAISRARDYLFIVMPDDETDGIKNLHKIAKIEKLVKTSGSFSEYLSRAIEEMIWGNTNYLEENTFSTGHQMVNVYREPERYYEVRSDDSAIDVQIYENDKVD